MFPFISQIADNYNSQSVYKNTNIDFIAPEPSFEQISELPGSNGIDKVFPFFLTKTAVNAGGNSRTTTVLLSDRFENVDITIACNFRRLVMLGFEKKKLNQAYHSYICRSGVITIIFAFALSSIVFLFADITAIRIILVIWIPLIELITLFTAATIINRRLWRK